MQKLWRVALVTTACVFLSINVLKAKEYEMFGCHFSVPDGGNYYIGKPDSYLWRLSFSSFTQEYTVGFVKKGQFELPEDVTAFNPDQSFAIEGLPGKPSMHYFSYRKKRVDYKSAYLVVDYSEMLDLVIEFDDYASQFGQNMEGANAVLKGMRATEPEEHIVNTSSAKGFKMKVHSVNGEQFLRGYGETTGPRLRDGINDELLLIWKDVRDQYHLTRLSKDGGVIKDLNFGSTAIYDAVAQQGFVAVLSSPATLRENPKSWESKHFYHHLYFEKYTWEMKKLVSTHLMGIDEIKKVGDQRFAFWGLTSTRLAWSGEYYAAHFATYRKWPDRVTHQADAFLLLDPEGKRMDESDEVNDNSCTWCVSHSFGQEMFFDGKKFMRFSLGDAYPRAIAVKRSHPEPQGKWTSKNTTFLKFPGKSGDNYVYDTDFSNAFAQNDFVYFGYTTELNVNGVSTKGYSNKRCNDIFLKKIDTAAKVKASYRLSNSPKTEERYLSIAPFGDSKVLCKWQTYNPKAPDGKNSAYSGSVQEQMGVYNLETKKWEGKTKLQVWAGHQLVSKFSLSSSGEHYYTNYGTEGIGHMGSQLFQDKEGRTWFVRFAIDRAGFDLVEVTQ